MTEAYLTRTRRSPYLILLATLLLSAPILQAQSDFFVGEFSFVFEGKQQDLKITFPKRLVDHYSNKTHYWPRNMTDYASHGLEDPGYEYISDFVAAVKQEVQKFQFDDETTARYLIAFVQSLKYIPETQEYVRYPIETLADGGGDCEDTSVLLAALLQELNYDVLLISPPKHMAVAIHCPSCSGAKIVHEGKPYYFIETTGSNLPIGYCKEEYRGTQVRTAKVPLHNPKYAATPGLHPRNNSGKVVYNQFSEKAR